MAMNLGIKTAKLWFVSNPSGSGDYNPSNDQYSNGFNHLGQWVMSNNPREEQYLDLGIITDEREDLSLGGIPYSTPGTGTQSRIYWAVGGKILRLTLTGIIPDGYYVSSNSLDDAIYHNRSNSSIFRYKLNRIISYQTVLDSLTNIHNVRYRRRGILENNGSVSKWVLTSYSFSYIAGTRNIQYTISLDQANNVNAGLRDGIFPRNFGDIL